MHTAQAGIFALGTSSHVYLEFDLVETFSQIFPEYISQESGIFDYSPLNL
jgi:hypothetical protein